MGSSANSTAGDDQRAPGDPLGLAAGQLARSPRLQAVDAEPVEPAGPRQRLVRRRPPSSSGRATFSTVSSGTSWPNWNRNPNDSAAQHRALVLAQVVDAAAGEAHLAVVGLEDAGEAVQQGRLARPRWAHDRPAISPAATGEVDAPQRGGRTERAVDVDGLQHVRHLDRTSSARSSSRAAVSSSQRRSASRWNRA